MIISIAILVLSLLALVYWLAAFVHGRVLEADLAELDRLHQEGLLPKLNSLEQDFQTLTSLLKAIAPAVEMRQAPWIRSYFLCLRISRAICSSSAWLEMELRRLVALQSCNYRRACARLADFAGE